MLDGGMEIHLPSGRSCSHFLHYLSGQSSSNNFIESKPKRGVLTEGTKCEKLPTVNYKR